MAPLRTTLLLAALLLIGGCSIDTSAAVPPSFGDGGWDDSSAPADSGLGDFGEADTGQTDSGPADSGPADSGPTDSGPADSSAPDTGAPDTGTPEVSCSELYGALVPAYRHCTGTPRTACVFKFGWGAGGVSAYKCDTLCGWGGLTCTGAFDRAVSINSCNQGASLPCSTQRASAICVCGSP